MYERWRKTIIFIETLVKLPFQTDKIRFLFFLKDGFWPVSTSKDLLMTTRLFFSWLSHKQFLDILHLESHSDYLYLIFHFASKVLNDESRFQYRSSNEELAVLVLLFELCKERLASGMRKTASSKRESHKQKKLVLSIELKLGKLGRGWYQKFPNIERNSAAVFPSHLLIFFNKQFLLHHCCYIFRSIGHFS